MKSRRAILAVTFLLFTACGSSSQSLISKASPTPISTSSSVPLSTNCQGTTSPGSQGTSSPAIGVMQSDCPKVTFINISQAQWDTLTTNLAKRVQQSGGKIAITLRELGFSKRSWSYRGDVQFTAVSTYKLPLLVAEAQGISNGTLLPSDLICYQPSDFEAGYYEDYVDSACYTRQELAVRVGTYSDNTAAHMLVRSFGGADVLNEDASRYGATNSSFYSGNVTTSNDLAAIWTTEYSGSVGGVAAQTWLYPLLTHTADENGVPAEVPTSISVVHKIGEIGSTYNDAALILNGGNPYILVVMTDSTNQGGFAPIVSISALVFQYEQQLN